MKNQSHTIKLAILFTTMLLAFGIQAQTEKIAFEKYGVAEGLPSERTYGVIQDHQGFIWVSTGNGLVKFDGYEMRVYKNDPDDPDSHHLDLVNSLFVASDSTIWFANNSRISSAGMASFDPKTQKFTNYYPDVNDSTKIPFNSASILFEDTDKNIWFKSIDYQFSDEPLLCKINLLTKEVSRYPHNGAPGKYNDLVLNAKMVNFKMDSTVWMLAANSDLQKYNRSKDEFEVVFEKWDTIPGSTQKDSIVDIGYAPKNGYITLMETDRFHLFNPTTNTIEKSYALKHGYPFENSGHFEDSYGNLWISAKHNLTRINPQTEDCKDYEFGTGELSFNVYGNLFQIAPEVQNEEYLYFQISSRDQWGYSYYATLRYDFAAHTFTFFNYKFNDDANRMGSYGRVSYLLDNTGLLWLSKSSNLFKEAPKKRRIELFTSDDNGEKSLPYDDVYSLFEDSKQRIWVCMDQGLALVDKDKGFLTYPLKGRDGSTGPTKVTYEIFEDSQGQIWARTNKTEKGLFRLDETSQEFMVCSSKIGQNTWAITEDDQGQIWVSDYLKGITVLDQETALPIQNFHSKDKDQHGLLDDRTYYLFYDSKGNLWTGRELSENGVFRFIEETNTFKHYAPDTADSLALYDGAVRKFFEDNQNQLWVRTANGLHRYDSENDVFRRHIIAAGNFGGSEIIEGENGNLWLQILSGNGLALYDPVGGTLEYFGEEHGLLHNDATNLILDDDSRIWLPTQRGLSVFDIQTKSFTNFYEKDGFQRYGNNNPVLKSSDGAIWIGGNHGLNKINPEKLFEVDQSTPNVVITQMGIGDSIYRQPDGELFSRAVSATDELTLEHWQKDLSFSFVGLHYLRPEDNQYSWKLENYDNKWSEPTKDRTTSYTNLSPGKYTFKVKASNADGFWSDEKAMTITILPPWWQTWWAYSIYAILLLAIGYRVHRAQRQRTIRKEREKVQQRELEQAKEIEEAYKELKSTQAQLVQSEKMASLGELTAGIAHEIQNPLNFVNNFSELNQELVEEASEELKNGEYEETAAILKDLGENSGKITHHGKRADAIVKGMLAHSRSGKGEKKPTDLNKLAEEYLKLSYHGLRAKDKSFNADFKTDFDPNLPKMNVVPQDIGRVLLNLINNAFQACTERSRSAVSGVSNPTVTVKTQLSTSDQVLLTITDNGPGIPPDIKDKIFQPFFTTKPTGQGTGLGLSLSYDIVKAHGGELICKSQAGKGTEFIVKLPQ